MQTLAQALSEKLQPGEHLTIIMQQHWNRRTGTGTRAMRVFRGEQCIGGVKASQYCGDRDVLELLTKLGIMPLLEVQKRTWALREFGVSWLEHRMEGCKLKDVRAWGDVQIEV